MAKYLVTVDMYELDAPTLLIGSIFTEIAASNADDANRIAQRIYFAYKSPCMHASVTVVEMV